MISKGVEILLHRSFVAARQARHKYVTVEHMGLEMLREAPVIEHLNSCAVNIEALRADLEAAVSGVEPSTADDIEPTPGFQRVIRAAILDVTSAGRREVSLLDLLAAALKDRESLFASRLWQYAEDSNTAVELARINALACSLCGTLTDVASLTEIAGRGVLCVACIDAVQAVKRSK